MVKSIEKVTETFELKFPNDLAIFRALWDERGDEGCPKCGNKAFQELSSGRCRRCTDNKCGHRRSVTAHTWLHKVQNVRARLLALWINRNGFMYSANKMKDIIGKGYASTWLGEHASRWLNDLQLSAELSASILRFVDIVARRTRQTPALKHPRLELIEGFVPDSGLMDAETDAPNTNITVSMMEHEVPCSHAVRRLAEMPIDDDSNVQSDSFHNENEDPDALGAPATRGTDDSENATPGGNVDTTDNHEVLDDASFVCSSQHPCGIPARTSVSFNNQSQEQSQCFTSVEDLISREICYTLRAVFQTVSVKYMQLYIAHLLFRTTVNSSIQDMLRAVLSARPFSGGDLRMYCTPRRCKLIPEWVLSAGSG